MQHLRGNVFRALVLVVAGGLFANPAVAEGSPTSEAERAVAEGRLDDALELYRSVADGSPDDLESRAWLVKLMSWTEQAEAAIPVLEEMVAISPKDDELAMQLAQYYIWFSRAEEAIPLYEAVAKRNPEDAEIRRKLIEANLWFSRADAALAAYKELYELDPSDREAALAYAKLLIQNGRSEQAIPVYEKLVEDDPESEEDLRYLIVLYGWNSRSKELLPAYEKLYAMQPDDLDVVNKLAQQYEWNERGKEAIPLLKRLVEKTPDDVGYRKRLAQQLAAAGEGEAAREHLEKVIKADPDDLHARFLLAQVAHWSPDWTIARDQYLAIIERDPSHKGARKYLPLLQAAHGPRLGGRAEVFRDTNDTLRFSESLFADAPITAPVRLGAGVIRRDYLGQHYLLGALRAAENRVTGNVTVARKWFYGKADVGVAHFGRDGSEPVANVELRANVRNKVTFGAAYDHARFTQGVPSIRDGINYDRIGGSIFAFPTKWLSGSMSGQLSWMSDRNLRRQSYFAVVAAPFRERFLLSATISAGHESFARLNPEALPYFTPNVWALSPGLDIGFQKKDKVRAEAGYSAVFDTHGNIVHTPRVKVTWNITPVDKLTAAYFHWGSPVYGYQMGFVTYEHRFRFRGQPRTRAASPRG